MVVCPRLQDTSPSHVSNLNSWLHCFQVIMETVGVTSTSWQMPLSLFELFGNKNNCNHRSHL